MTEKFNKIDFGPETDKKEVVEIVDEWIESLGLGIKETDKERPWGAFWRINDKDLERFLKLFFPEMNGKEIDLAQNLSPKFLLVGPGERLSWQYHFRRSEKWRVVIGEVIVKQSKTDKEPESGSLFTEGDAVDLECGVRHRLIGGEGWGLVAEVWEHTDQNHLSDEEDIVRLADDYGRENKKSPSGEGR